MKNTENMGFLPTVPFKGDHPDMHIGWQVSAEEKANDSVYAVNTETWD